MATNTNQSDDFCLENENQYFSLSKKLFILLVDAKGMYKTTFLKELSLNHDSFVLSLDLKMFSFNLKDILDMIYIKT